MTFDPEQPNEYVPQFSWWWLVGAVIMFVAWAVGQCFGTSITSTNWAGYADTGSTFSKASGQWNVPTITDQTGMVAQWVGLDGANNQFVEQIGTWEISRPTSQGQILNYFAWYEMYPLSNIQIYSINVSPGDNISASVTGSSGSFDLSLTDLSNGQSFTTTQTSAGPSVSAEWVNEVFIGQTPAAFDPIHFIDTNTSAKSTFSQESISVPNVESPSQMVNNSFTITEVPEIGVVWLMLFGGWYGLTRRLSRG